MQFLNFFLFLAIVSFLSYQVEVDAGCFMKDISPQAPIPILPGRGGCAHPLPFDALAHSFLSYQVEVDE